MIELLSLISSEMGPVGARKLAEAIASNKKGNLNWLMIHHNKIGDEGIEQFSNTLSAEGKHLKLNTLDVSHNFITPKGLWHASKLLDIQTLEV